MQCRAVILIGAIGAAALASCSGPNPAAIIFQDREGEAPPGPSTSPTGTTPGGNNPGGGPDGGGGPGGPSDNLIFGNTTFRYTAPTMQANDVINHTSPVAGQNCIVDGCHLTNSRKWVFAGTLYTTKEGTTPVTRAEVRVVTGDGQAIGSAYTDDDGNFWFAGPGQLVAGSKVGVRTEGGQSAYMAMALGANDKGCNANALNCHGTAAQGKVHVP